MSWMMVGSISRRYAKPPGRPCALACEATTTSAITIALTILPPAVMAGLVPAIHVFFTVNCTEDVDARAKRGHDEEWTDRGITRNRFIRACPAWHLCL